MAAVRRTVSVGPLRGACRLPDVVTWAPGRSALRMDGTEPAYTAGQGVIEA